MLYYLWKLISLILTLHPTRIAVTPEPFCRHSLLYDWLFLFLHSGLSSYVHLPFNLTKIPHLFLDQNVTSFMKSSFLFFP
jgi:hypothetical protein